MVVVRDVVRVHRLEYPFPVAYLCHVLWGAAYAASAPSDLLKPLVLLVIVANLIPIVAQNLLNGAFDVQADSRNPGKGGIAVATSRLGRVRVIRWALAEMTVAIVLGVICSVLLGRPLVAVAVVAGVLIELAYNLEPVRLKRRGVLNPLSLGLHMSFIPCVGTYAALRDDFPAWVWAVFAGVGLLLIGRTLWWSIPDLRGDAEAGDRPLAVRYGAHRAMVIACGVTVLGLLSLGWGLWARYGPWWALPTVAVCALFLVDKLRTLRWISDTNLPHERRMRRTSLTMVIAADVLLVVVPLVAPAT
ncbi:hypothetical protein FKR81_33445 [Lentzea tibetensis]|uniref:4-hydroxybenzoate polyprenyltransferase n=1 Tax=Lentzea tibetensis TaxID=2591470 RepID=A0A563EJM8_9PSEU|nr:UbiA family prenyltransferase [Lentzea tibetensis]TWP46963.1 hypothetical protein FKR81_33445 [Lentzea tibetensis]